MNTETNIISNNFQTANNTISNEVYKDSVLNEIKIPAITPLKQNLDIEAVKGKRILIEQMKYQYQVSEFIANRTFELRNNEQECIDYIKSVIPKRNGYPETYAEELHEIVSKFDVLNPDYELFKKGKQEEVKLTKAAEPEPEINNDIEDWIKQEAKTFNVPVAEVQAKFGQCKNDNIEAGVEEAEAIDFAQDQVHAYFVAISGKKQKQEVIVEIPEYDFKFTITYDDGYKITIPNVKISYSVKKTLLEINKSRDADLCDYLCIYGEIEKELAKKLVNEFNKKIANEYFNKIKSLAFKEKEETKDEETKAEPYEVPEIMQKAEEILKTGNPHEYMMNVYQTIHRGDRIAFSVIFLAIANQSIKNSKGLQVSFNGDSSDGKSHAVKSTKRLIPKHQIIDASMSSKALFYHPDLKEKTIIYSDDTEIPSDLENTLKRSMTNFQEETEHLTVDGEKKGKKLFIPKRMVYLFSSVEEKGGQELQNRKIQVTIEDSRAHKYSIVQNQTITVMNGYDPYLNEPTEDMLICQAIFHKLHEQDFGVAIPFADRIEGFDIKNVRNNDKFFNMIMGFTLSKYMQREKDANGNLIATIEDFNDAAEIYNKIYKNVTTNLTDAEIKMCKVISSFGFQGATSKEIQTILDISQTMVSRRLQSIETKLSNFMIDDGSESEGYCDGNGNTSSTSKKVKHYYINNFNENNLNKSVYLVENKINFDELIKQAKLQENKQKIEEKQKELDAKREKELQNQPKKLNLLQDHFDVNNENTDSSVSA